MAAVRLTCTQESSRKFWEGTVEGSSLVVRFGKIGTSGQRKQKSLASAAAAEAELVKLVRQKQREGYVTETPDRDAAPERASATPAVGATPDLAALWTQLERYVETTPRRLHLRPPAKEAQIRAAERTMKVVFPEDFRASLRVHDGQEVGDGDESDTFPWLAGHPRLASLDRIVEAWKDQCRTFEQLERTRALPEIDGGRMIRSLWHPGRIPIAGNPWWDQDNTYLDFLPGSKGTPGQLVMFGKGYVDGLWCGPSFGAAFALYVEAVTSRTWLWESGSLAGDESKPRPRRRYPSWTAFAVEQLSPGDRGAKQKR